jgi:hypothetical protein
MSGKRNTPTFEEFVKRHKITRCAGFWWCGKGPPADEWEGRDYRACLLASLEEAERPQKPKWPKSVVVELHAPSVRGLAARIREVGFEPPRRLGALCESARTSPRP